MSIQTGKRIISMLFAVILFVLLSTAAYAGASPDTNHEEPQYDDYEDFFEIKVPLKRFR